MKQKMDIGIITPISISGSLGGTEISVKLLSERLVESGHSVTVYSFNSETYSKQTQNGVDLVQFKHPKKIPNWKFDLNKITYNNLLDVVKEHDILHVYMTVQIPSVGRLGARYNIPVVATLNVHGLICPDNTLLNIDKPCNKFAPLKCVKCILYKDLIKDKDKITKIIDNLYTIAFCKYALKSKGLVDKYIAISEVIKQKHVENGFDEKKIFVIPNMVDPNFHVKKILKNNSIPIILYVGRLDPRKGVDILVKSVPKILEKRQIEVWIIGDGRDRKKLERLIAEKKIVDKVKFFGEIKYENLPEFYDKADIFVHPAKWIEPFGRTLLEAMASGIPIISSDISISPEIVDGCGLRYTNNDPQSLADAVLKLLKENRLREEFIRNGYMKLKTCFGTDIVIEKIVSLYIDLLDVKREYV